MVNWTCRVTSLIFGGLGVICLLAAAGGAMENPSNPADLSGIPAISMYVVILLGLFLISGVMLVLTAFVEKVLLVKIAEAVGFYLWILSMLLLGGLGLVVALAYRDGLYTYLAGFTFVTSLYLLFLSFKQYRLSRS